MTDQPFSWSVMVSSEAVVITRRAHLVDHRFSCWIPEIEAKVDEDDPPPEPRARDPGEPGFDSPEGDGRRGGEHDIIGLTGVGIESTGQVHSDHMRGGREKNAHDIASCSTERAAGADTQDAVDDKVVCGGVQIIGANELRTALGRRLECFVVDPIGSAKDLDTGASGCDGCCGEERVAAVVAGPRENEHPFRSVFGDDLSERGRSPVHERHAGGEKRRFGGADL